MTGMTLTEFLRARLDEDEAITRSYARPGSPIGTPTDESVGHIYSPDCSRDREADVEGFLGGVADPDRVLAEVDAKRRIVEHTEACKADRNRRDDGESRYREMWWTCVTLAKVYADHPDYREWKP